MRRLVLCGLLFFVSNAAIAQLANVPRAERIAKVMGLEQLLLAAQVESVDSAKAQTDLLLEQLRTAGMSESATKKLTPRVQEFLRKVSQAWDPKVATRIYAEGLTQALTDKELDEAERYYSSPEGKRTYAAIVASQQKVQAYVDSSTNEVLQVEIAGFMEAVKKAVAENPK